MKSRSASNTKCAHIQWVVTLQDQTLSVTQATAKMKMQSLRAKVNLSGTEHI